MSSAVLPPPLKPIVLDGAAIRAAGDLPHGERFFPPMDDSALARGEDDASEGSPESVIRFGKEWLLWFEGFLPSVQNVDAGEISDDGSVLAEGDQAAVFPFVIKDESGRKKVYGTYKVKPVAVPEVEDVASDAIVENVTVEFNLVQKGEDGSVVEVGKLTLSFEVTKRSDVIVAVTDPTYRLDSQDEKLREYFTGLQRAVRPEVFGDPERFPEFECEKVIADVNQFSRDHLSSGVTELGSEDFKQGDISRINLSAKGFDGREVYLPHLPAGGDNQLLFLRPWVDNFVGSNYSGWGVEKKAKLVEAILRAFISNEGLLVQSAIADEFSRFSARGYVLEACSSRLRLIAEDSGVSLVVENDVSSLLERSVDDGNISSVCGSKGSVLARYSCKYQIKFADVDSPPVMSAVAAEDDIPVVEVEFYNAEYKSKRAEILGKEVAVNLYDMQDSLAKLRAMPLDSRRYTGTESIQDFLKSLEARIDDYFIAAKLDNPNFDSEDLRNKNKARKKCVAALGDVINLADVYRLAGAYKYLASDESHNEILEYYRLFLQKWVEKNRESLADLQHVDAQLARVDISAERRRSLVKRREIISQALGFNSLEWLEWIGIPDLSATIAAGTEIDFSTVVPNVDKLGSNLLWENLVTEKFEAQRLDICAKFPCVGRIPDQIKVDMLRRKVARYSGNSIVQWKIADDDYLADDRVLAFCKSQSELIESQNAQIRQALGLEEGVEINTKHVAKVMREGENENPALMQAYLTYCYENLLRKTPSGRAFDERTLDLYVARMCAVATDDGTGFGFFPGTVIGLLQQTLLDKYPGDLIAMRYKARTASCVWSVDGDKLSLTVIAVVTNSAGRELAKVKCEVEFAVTDPDAISMETELLEVEEGETKYIDPTFKEQLNSFMEDGSGEITSPRLRELYPLQVNLEVLEGGFCSAGNSGYPWLSISGWGRDNDPLFGYLQSLTQVGAAGSEEGVFSDDDLQDANYRSVLNALYGPMSEKGAAAGSWVAWVKDHKDEIEAHFALSDQQLAGPINEEVTDKVTLDRKKCHLMIQWVKIINEKVFTYSDEGSESDEGPEKSLCPLLKDVVDGKKEVSLESLVALAHNLREAINELERFNPHLFDILDVDICHSHNALMDRLYSILDEVKKLSGKILSREESPRLAYLESLILCGDQNELTIASFLSHPEFQSKFVDASAGIDWLVKLVCDSRNEVLALRVLRTGFSWFDKDFSKQLTHEHLCSIAQAFKFSPNVLATLSKRRIWWWQGRDYTKVARVVKVSTGDSQVRSFGATLDGIVEQGFVELTKLAGGVERRTMTGKDLVAHPGSDSGDFLGFDNIDKLVNWVCESYDAFLAEKLLEYGWFGRAKGFLCEKLESEHILQLAKAFKNNREVLELLLGSGSFKKGNVFKPNFAAKLSDADALGIWNFKEQELLAERSALRKHESFNLQVSSSNSSDSDLSPLHKYCMENRLLLQKRDAAVAAAANMTRVAKGFLVRRGVQVALQPAVVAVHDVRKAMRTRLATAESVEGVEIPDTVRMSYLQMPWQEVKGKFKIKFDKEALWDRAIDDAGMPTVRPFDAELDAACSDIWVSSLATLHRTAQQLRTVVERVGDSFVAPIDGRPFKINGVDFRSNVAGFAQAEAHLEHDMDVMSSAQRKMALLLAWPHQLYLQSTANRLIRSAFFSESRDTMLPIPGIPQRRDELTKFFIYPEGDNLRVIWQSGIIYGYEERKVGEIDLQLLIDPQGNVQLDKAEIAWSDKELAAEVLQAVRGDDSTPAALGLCTVTGEEDAEVPTEVVVAKRDDLPAYTPSVEDVRAMAREYRGMLSSYRNPAAAVDGSDLRRLSYAGMIQLLVISGVEELPEVVVEGDSRESRRGSVDSVDSSHGSFSTDGLDTPPPVEGVGNGIVLRGPRSVDGSNDPLKHAIGTRGGEAAELAGDGRRLRSGSCPARFVPPIGVY